MHRPVSHRRLSGGLAAVGLVCALLGGCGDDERAPDPEAEEREAVARSPLPDAEAEVLAIEASGELVAPEAVYARIVDDLAAIRGAHPAVRDIAARPTWAPNTLLVAFDAQGAAAVESGAYTAWHDLNVLYAMSPDRVTQRFYALRSPRRFNTPLLAAAYTGLPHVIGVGPDPTVGDGDDVCVSFEGDVFSYVFDAGSGDCPSGCIEHTYRGFTTSAEGDVVTLGTWPRRFGESPPPWFAALAACTRWL